MAGFRHQLQTCPCCGARGSCSIHAYYDRSLVDFMGGSPVRHSLCIMRLICTCGHTHAILPDFIIPYSGYGLFFLLRVLAEYFLRLSFAIIPALFMGLYPGLSALNIMGLHSPQSAVLSAIIYNALIIIALIPLALKGVKYREVSAGKLLSRNLLIYGLGGLAAPFIFVKLIDVLLVMTGLV